jgi:hypothetical protein
MRPRRGSTIGRWCRSRGEIDQRGRDLRYVDIRAPPRSAAIAALADRTAARLRAHESAAGRCQREDSPRRFHHLHPPARLEPPTQDTAVPRGRASLLDGWLARQPNAAVRLLGVGVERLADDAAADLF